MTAHRITVVTLGMMAIPLGKNRQFVILDHGIGEQVVGDLVELCLAGPIHLDLNRLADPDGKNSLEAQMLHGAASGDAGGIENGRFGHDGDNSFHEDWKIGRERVHDKPKSPKHQKHYFPRGQFSPSRSSSLSNFSSVGFTFLHHSRFSFQILAFHTIFPP